MGDRKNQLPTTPQLDALVAFKRIQLRLEAAGETRDPHPDEVSDELGLTRTASRRLLDQLETKSLIHRAPVTVPGPRRITEEGERWLAILASKKTG